MNEEAKKPEQEQPKKQIKEEKPPAEKAASEEMKTKEEKPAAEKAQPEKKPTVAQTAQEKEAGAKKKRKINRLTLKELEKRIQEVQEKMGSLASTYAQQLLKRKEQLLAEKETRNPAYAKASSFAEASQDSSAGRQKPEAKIQTKQESAKAGGDNATNS